MVVIPEGISEREEKENMFQEQQEEEAERWEKNREKRDNDN